MLSGRSGFLGIGLMLEPKLRQTRAAQSLQSDGASPILDCGVFGMYDGLTGSYSRPEVDFEETTIVSSKPVSR